MKKLLTLTGIAGIGTALMLIHRVSDDGYNRRYGPERGLAPAVGL